MRYKPVGELTDGEIRTAMGQQFSLAILVPMALDRLRQNPLLEADLFEGDLLKSVLSVKPAFWLQQPGLWHEANEIALAALALAVDFDDAWHEHVKPDLQSTLAVL